MRFAVRRMIDRQRLPLFGRVHGENQHHPGTNRYVFSGPS
jgi:hypothetical protein